MNDRILANQFIKKSRFSYRKLNLQVSENLPVTDISELDSIIKDLDSNKAPGIDNVSNKLIKILYESDKYFLQISLI